MIVALVLEREARMTRTIGVALCAAALLGAGDARAQASRDAARTDGADFDRVNPGIGFGWFGLSGVPVGGGSGGETASAPVLGIRWWTGAPLGPFRAWGVDVGAGIGRNLDAARSGTTRTAFLVHAGLPLVVTASRHVAIELIPEANLGFAGGSSDAGPDVGGSRLDLGARAGAEVFFGFMGLPQLAVEGSVGLFLTRESRSVRPVGGTETSDSLWRFGTTVGNQPWDIFRTSVAARYYF
jgi:hypothetical protein